MFFERRLGDEGEWGVRQASVGLCLRVGLLWRRRRVLSEARAVVVMIFCVAHFVVVSDVNVAVISLMTGEYRGNGGVDFKYFLFCCGWFRTVRCG